MLFAPPASASEIHGIADDRAGRSAPYGRAAHTTAAWAGGNGGWGPPWWRGAENRTRPNPAGRRAWRPCTPARGWGADEICGSPPAPHHRGTVEEADVVADHRSTPVGVAGADRHRPRRRRPGTAREQQRQHHGRERADHCAAPGGVVSVQSITPITAPAGSASSATVPPWRSWCGSTTTRPPNVFAASAALETSATRTKAIQCGCTASG